MHVAPGTQSPSPKRPASGAPAVVATPPEAPSQSEATKPGRRRQAKNACGHCKQANKKCEDARPCERCVTRGIADSCVNSERKERPRGLTRGPYRRRQTSSSSEVTPTRNDVRRDSSLHNEALTAQLKATHSHNRQLLPTTTTFHNIASINYTQSHGHYILPKFTLQSGNHTRLLSPLRQNNENPCTAVMLPPLPAVLSHKNSFKSVHNPFAPKVSQPSSGNNLQSLNLSALRMLSEVALDENWQPHTLSRKESSTEFKSLIRANDVNQQESTPVQTPDRVSSNIPEFLDI